MPTLIFEDTFETGGTWDGSNGTPVIVSSPVPPSSSKALEVNAVGDFVFWNIPDSGYTRVVLGTWLRWATLPAGDRRVFKIDFGPTEGWVYTTSGGTPSIQGDGTPSIPNVSYGSALSTNTWYWVQLMADVSANPWELRLKIGGTVVSSTGAAAASNLNAGNFLLGPTTGASYGTAYFGHMKAGVAANDDDWWDEPSAPGIEFKRFYGPAQLTGSAATLYTCPSGRRARVLGIHASNPSASEVDLNLSIGTDAAATRVYDDFPVAADSVESNYDPYDLAEGDVIQGWAGTAGTLVLTVTGYEVPE